MLPRLLLAAVWSDDGGPGLHEHRHPAGSGETPEALPGGSLGRAPASPWGSSPPAADDGRAEPGSR
eukprot:1366627-Alexandrium_andersonii.AAC.1